ncbi:MAG: transposase [Candidatus Blackburnbacteria bacterium]|nr:transposase [Candidatus Blackburnbacteria bacterium]
MPSNRKIVFANNEYYHVFNRGVEKRPTFTTKYEFLRAVNSINFYRFGNLPMRYSKYLVLDKDKKEQLLKGLNNSQLQVEIIAYCLMGNHFHILLKQLQETGVVKFMAKFTNSYTKYFNTKHQRVGPLFQGIFKSVHIEDDEQLLHLSRYIHLNPVTNFIVTLDELANYRWSSYPEYLNIVNTGMINKGEVRNFFKNSREYEKFVFDQVEHLKQMKTIEHLTID